MADKAGVPQYQELLWPTVVALRDLGGSGSISEIEQKVVANEQFTDRQQAVIHGDGPKSEIGYRIDWARTYLKGMGLATNSQRGVWTLTEAGRAVTQDRIGPLRAEYIKATRKARKRSKSSADDDGRELAADDASFANPVARMSGMGVELLLEPWDLGIRKAKEFLWTGEPLGAADAAAAGMVNRVVPRAELADAARALAETIALVPPVTAERIKDSVNHTYELMGKRQSWQYHFMAHHFTHNTATALGMLADRQGMGSMREVFEARDRGDAPAS